MLHPYHTRESSAFELGKTLADIDHCLESSWWSLRETGLRTALAVIEDQKKNFADRESGGQVAQWERLRDEISRQSGAIQSMLIHGIQREVERDPDGARGVALVREMRRSPGGRMLEHRASDCLEELRELLRKLAGQQHPWLEWGQRLGQAFWDLREGRTPTSLELPPDMAATDCELVKGRFWPAVLDAHEVGHAYRRLRLFLADHYHSFLTVPRFEGRGEGGVFAIGLNELHIASRSHGVLAGLLADLHEAGWPERHVWRKMAGQKKQNERRGLARGLRPTLSRFLSHQLDKGFDPVLRLSVELATCELVLHLLPAAEAKSPRAIGRKTN